MKKLILISILAYLFGCETLTEYTIPINKYPASLGKEWEYSTIWRFEYYDSTGNIDSLVSQGLENTIVRIVNDRELIISYENAILFESFDINSPQYVGKVWYVNSDTGFYGIAYSNPGSMQPVLPKRNPTRSDILNYIIKTNSMQPGFVSSDITLINNSDSIQFYSPPRKVLAYPLKVGMSWVEFAEPFLKERDVIDYLNISLNGRTYNCFKIESNISSFNITLIDYIDMNYGLVMREIGSDSIAIVSFSSPDSVIGYYKSTTSSKLVRTKN